MSNHPFANNPLLLSQQFYFFITDQFGKVLQANSIAKEIIDDKIDIDALSINTQHLQHPQQIALTHGAKKIKWEVVAERSSIGEMLFSWIGVKSNDNATSEQNNKLKLLADLVEQTADVLTAADPDFKPITWNKAAEEVYGITAEEIIGKNLRDYLDIHYPYATKEEVRNTIAEKGEWRGEMCFVRRRDNKFMTLLITFKLLKDEEDNNLGYIISAFDISSIKETELKLKESESRFREVADSAPVCIWMMDANDKLVYVNKPYFDFTGLSKLSNDLWGSLIHPDDELKTRQTIGAHIIQRLPVKIIFRLKNVNGEYVWMQCTGMPRFLNDGTYIGYIATCIDINETKIKEEQFHYQASVLENVLDIIVTTDPEFKIKTFNKVAEEYYGFKQEEVIGKLVSEVVDFGYSSGNANTALVDLQKNGTWKGEVTIQREDKTIYLLATVTYMYDAAGNRNGIMALSRDITDRKIIEEKLKQSEAFYRSLIADSLDGMILADDRGIITFVSPPVKNILGYGLEEVLGRNTLEFVHPEDLVLAGDAFQKEVTQSPEIKFIVIRLLKKNGEWLWCMVRGHNQLSNPYIGSMIVYFHDDTLRKEATLALRESEQRFKNIVSNLQFGVVMQNVEGKVLMCNKTVLDLLEIESEKELIGGSILEKIDSIITEDGISVQPSEHPLFKAIRDKKSVRNVVFGIYHTRFSERKWILVNYDPIVDEYGNLLHIICTITDITERKKLEQELLREKINHQKLLTQASIEGQEAERREIGKELHDNIGQQLTTTKLFLEIAKSTADDSTLEMVNLALKGISDVINEVRGISRALVPHTLGDLGLIDSVNDLIETIQRTQKLSIDLDYFNFDEDAVPENQKLMLFRVIQEQLNNIVKHANATQVSIILKNTDKELELEIKDDGSGFDLKKVRKGLGLMNIKNRVEVFDGTLLVSASPGNGCTLQIQIPMAVQQLL